MQIPSPFMSSSLPLPLDLSPFQRKLVGFLAGGLLAFLVLFVATLAHLREAVQNDELARENFQRLQGLQQAVTHLQAAESSQRAYAATGAPLFLQDHLDQRELLERSMEELLALPADGQAAELQTRFREQVDRRSAGMDELVALRDEQGLQAAVGLIASYEGRQLMAQVRDTSQRLVSLERERLDQRGLNAEQNTIRLLWLLGALSAVLALLLIGAWLAVRSELRRNLVLARQLAETGREVSLINQLSSGLQSCGARDDIAEVLEHYLSRLFAGSSGGLYLMRPSRNLLEQAASWGDSGSESASMEPQECWALRMGGVHVRHPGSQALACRHYSEDGTVHLCIPLSAQSDIIGVLHLADIPEAALEDTRELAERLAPHLSAAVGGIILREALRQQNVRDPLTGLYNRRYLEETMAREVVRATRSGQPFSFLMIDIDHFKRFNDEHGHQAGDVMLKAFADYLARHVRGDDIVCRYGGEEFLLVLPGANTAQAAQRAEAVRSQLASLHVTHRGESLPRVAASIGVSSFPTHGQDWESALNLADAALYHAKHNGRDQVAMADDVLKAVPTAAASA